MFVVGLTGGIGSGKTAVSDRFQSLGIRIVDADLAARKVVEPGSDALQQIKKRFGPQIIQTDGGLNRAALRKIIFSDPDERRWLEQLLHPLIGIQIAAEIDAADSPYAVFVSPLLIETEQIQLIDRLLVIDVPEKTQIARTTRRDRNSEEQVRAIIATQSSREKRLSMADDVIVNDQGLEHLDQSVSQLHRKYLKLAALKS